MGTGWGGGMREGDNRNFYKELFAKPCKTEKDIGIKSTQTVLVHRSAK